MIKPEAPRPTAGDRYGDFELIAPVASGGMAVVWAACSVADRAAEKLFAIKIMRSELDADDDARRMFLDEGRLAACLRHPNVCQVHFLGNAMGHTYLVMEWIDGIALRAVPMPSCRVAASIVVEVCQGLHYAHEVKDSRGTPLDLVHRDVTPHNILIDLEGNVKLADFGIAKAAGFSRGTTQLGLLKGKAGYMPPEMLDGGGFDRRADIFALGCVLYELTTGQRTFTGSNDIEILRKTICGTVRKPSEVVPDYPVDLEQIVLRALATLPERRYASARDLGADLSAWLTQNGSQATRTEIAETLQRSFGPALSERNLSLQTLRRELSKKGVPKDLEPAIALSKDSAATPLVTHAGASKARWVWAFVATGVAVSLLALSQLLRLEREAALVTTMHEARPSFRVGKSAASPTPQPMSGPNSGRNATPRSTRPTGLGTPRPRPSLTFVPEKDPYGN